MRCRSRAGVPCNRCLESEKRLNDLLHGCQPRAYCGFKSAVAACCGRRRRCLPLAATHRPGSQAKLQLRCCIVSIRAGPSARMRPRTSSSPRGVSCSTHPSRPAWRRTVIGPDFFKRSTGERMYSPQTRPYFFRSSAGGRRTQRRILRACTHVRREAVRRA